MAETRKIKIDIDTNADEAAKDFGKLADNIDDSADKVKELNSVVKKTDSATKGAEGGFKKIGSAVKGLGTALKAAGIGLIIGALAGLKSAFESNEETARGFSVIMETLSILFNQTVGAISKAVQAAYQATGGFNALGKVMGGLLNLVLTPFKAVFFGLKLGLQELQLAWEKSFFGDKDPDTIKQLRKNIKQTQNDLKEVGEDAIKSGKDIYNNFGEAVDEIVTLGVKGVEQIGKISVKAAYEQAGALVDARNIAAIAAAQQGRLVEMYDRQAESIRQIRDEERNSIADRRKANNDLLNKTKMKSPFWTVYL
jgi:methyl-accepting chemotaxis protein